MPAEPGWTSVRSHWRGDGRILASVRHGWRARGRLFASGLGRQGAAAVAVVGAGAAVVGELAVRVVEPESSPPQLATARAAQASGTHAIEASRIAGILGAGSDLPGRPVGLQDRRQLDAPVVALPVL